MIRFFIFWSFLFSINLDEWDSITSILSPNKLISHNNNLVGSTSGGLLVYDIINEEFVNHENSECINISDIELDLDDELWILCNNGILFKQNSSLIINHLDIDNAYNLTISEQSIFFIYDNNGSKGIIDVGYNDDTVFFKDYYQGFTSADALFNKISILNNVIYLLTSDGIYYADLNTNLKFPSNWTIIDNTENVIDISAFNDRMILIYQDRAEFINVDNIISDESIQIEANTSYDINLYINSYYNATDFYILSDTKIINIDTQGFNVEYEDDFSDATSLFVGENQIYIGVQDQGFWQLDNNIDKCVPNTLLSSDVEAISYYDGTLYGLNRNGLFIYDYNSFYNLLSDNSENSFLTDFYNCNDFQGTQLEYISGSKISTSLVYYNNKLYVPNSGILPDQDNNKGGLIIIDTDDLMINSIIDTSYLDGLGGIYYQDIDNGYMTINQVIKDSYNKIWVVNPYAEHTNNILTYFNPLDETWGHIQAPDNISYLPQEVAFDKWGRIWVAMRNELNINGEPYSSGGLKLVTENGSWLDVEGLDELPGEDDNVSVWSIDFGRFEGNDILWVLSSNGVMGYSISGNRIDPIYPINFFTDIPFSKGDKVRVDPQNNVWIITAHSGIRVIKNDISFWPSSDGLTVENSNILSNTVRDIAFDSENGLAFIATDKGISILGIPFKHNQSNKNISVGPNPFIIGTSEYITIENIYSGSTIKIMTLSGQVVQTIKLPYNENRVNWNGKADSGKYLDSGIYLVSVENDRYGNGVTKIAIIK